MTHMRIASLACILLASACAPLPAPVVVCPECPPAKPAPETAMYIQTTFGSLSEWPTVGLAQSLRAFLAGCPRPGALAQACTDAARVPLDDEGAARDFFETAFVPYSLLSSTSGDTGLVTGYYEPVLEGSRAPTKAHRFPIFGVPEDMIVVDLGAAYPDLRHMRLRGRLEGRRLLPYFSRAEIESRGLAFGAPVLAWTADPVELFFLQIQGSGQVQLPDGERLRVGYADQNGHPYRSLGRWLVDRGEIALEQASMQGIKAWASANPHKLQEALNSNPSYVFFRELPPTNGPIGALGVPLTAQYSLAVDRRFVPLGAPVLLATTYPASEERLERLMAAQDTGGAIRGVVRSDFYWGTGAEAGSYAGRMRQRGRMWLLWPKGEPPPGN
jgi:membrane-bound lytic murein transglycosylase A